MNSELKASARFDHERLDVYQLELRFIQWAAPLLDEVSESTKGRKREIVDQLERASLSALLNTAEGNGRRQRQTRAKFFDDARGSATECAACLDALVAKKLVAAERVAEGKVLLLRVVSILCRLIERFDSDLQMREEEAVEYRTSSLSKPRTRTRTRTKDKIYGSNQN